MRFNFIAQQREKRIATVAKGKGKAGKWKIEQNGTERNSPRGVVTQLTGKKAKKKKYPGQRFSDNRIAILKIWGTPFAIGELARLPFAICHLHASQIRTSFRIHWRVCLCVCADYCLLIFNLFLIFRFFARSWHVMSVFPSVFPSSVCSCLIVSFFGQLPVCFGNFLAVLLKCIAHFPRCPSWLTIKVSFIILMGCCNLLLPLYQRSPLASCLHVWPTRQLKSRTHQVASCNWIFYPDCRSLGKKATAFTCNNSEICMWHEIRVAHGATATGLLHVWSVQRGACSVWHAWAESRTMQPT